jgi:hypothetical protein
MRLIQTPLTWRTRSLHLGMMGDSTLPGANIVIMRRSRTVGRARKKRNTGKSKKGSPTGAALLVETMKDGQSAFLEVMQITHKSTIEQSFKIHKEREVGKREV